MRLPDQFHCPTCKGRLNATSADALQCTSCERTIRVVDGIADFIGGSFPLPDGSDRYRGDPRFYETGSGTLFARIKFAASDRWPTSLGDTIEFGCGRGATTRAIVDEQMFRSLLVLDTGLEMVQACRNSIASLGREAGRPVAYATLSGAQDAISDAVADTIIGTGLLSGVSDVRAFLAMAYRVMKPGGRAMFLVPNRRYYEAMCLAMAEAMVQRRALDGAWPEGQEIVLAILSQIRRLLVHRGDCGFLSGLEEKHLFDSEELEDLGKEVGFTAVEMIPLDPDPAGAETIRRFCREAGAPDNFTEGFGSLAAAVGRPFFDLLGRQDRSASMLLWLTKTSQPPVRIFTQPPAPPRIGFADADAAVGGATPRWSVELLARDTPSGIVLSLGGWCLFNTDVRWIRVTLDEVIRHAPVWRPRPDVHEVLGRSGLYHPMNTLCSGMASEMLFDDLHANNGACSLRLEIVLLSGLVVSGPAPEALLMDEPMVIAH
jgi:SAM-dependent methyltransferase